GYKVLGIGHFYTATSGTTLIASAIGSAAVTPANMGNVYAFHGQPGAGGVVSITSADNVFTGPTTGARIGTNLTNLGSMFSGALGVGVGSVLDTVNIPGGHGGAYLMSGASGTNPFQTKQTAYLAGAGLSGGVLIGGGLPGSDTSLSLIGDSRADLVVGGQ